MVVTDPQLLFFSCEPLFWDRLQSHIISQNKILSHEVRKFFFFSPIKKGCRQKLTAFNCQGQNFKSTIAAFGSNLSFSLMKCYCGVQRTLSVLLKPVGIWDMFASEKFNNYSKIVKWLSKKLTFY